MYVVLIQYCCWRQQYMINIVIIAVFIQRDINVLHGFLIKRCQVYLWMQVKSVCLKCTVDMEFFATKKEIK